jgi:hypothetical protein
MVPRYGWGFGSTSPHVVNWGPQFGPNVSTSFFWHSLPVAIYVATILL